MKVYKHLLVLLFSPLLCIAQSSYKQEIDSIYAEGDLVNTISKGINYSKSTSDDSIKSHLYLRIGQAFFKQFNDKRALDFFNKSLELKKQLYNYDNLDIIKLYRNISMCNNYLGHYETANESLDTALSIINKTETKDTSIWIQLYIQKSRLLVSNREFDQAYQYLISALEICNSSATDQSNNLITIYELLSTLAIDRSNPKEIKKWTDSITALLNRSELQNQYEYQANLYNNIADYFRLTNSLDSAIYYTEKSAGLNKVLGKFRINTLASNYSNLSVYLKDIGEYEKAIGYVNKALNIDIKAGNTSSVVSDYENKVSIYLEANQVELAKSPMNQLIEFIDAHKESINKTSIINAYKTKVKYENKLWVNTKTNEQELLRTTDEMTEFLNELRSSFITDESKNILAEDGREIYDILIKSLIDIYNNNKNEDILYKALLLADQSKSLTLLDAVITNLSDSELARTELSVRYKISELESKASMDNSNLDIKNELLTTYEQLREIKTQLLKDDKYHQVAFANELNKESIKAIDKPILNYYFTKDQAYLFYQHNKKLESITLSPTDTIMSLIDDLIKNIATGSKADNLSLVDRNKSFVKLSQAAHELYTILIPTELQFGNNVDSSIVIIPDGYLYNLPFDVLLKSPVNEKHNLLGNYNYLIKDFSISYAYSLKLYLTLQGIENKSTDAKILSFAPSFNFDSTGLKPLEYNSFEVSQIKNIFGGKTFIGRDASRENFISEHHKFDVIHIATHAETNISNSELSNILHSNNSKLYLDEIYSLDVNASMVVLNACETGVGKLRTGEGMMSLGRGFIYAGAASVVMTLWPVDDKKSSEIMIDFYRHLGNNNSKDESLRAAKLSFIENYSHLSHPYYWAPFVNFGNVDSIKFKKPIFIKPIIPIILLLTFGLLIYHILFRKK